MAVTTLTSRLIYLEDLATTVNPAGAAETAQVFTGAGATAVTVNRIPVVLMTHYEVADNDVAAAALGVAVGECYVDSSGKLRCRLS